MRLKNFIIVTEKISNDFEQSRSDMIKGSETIDSRSTTPVAAKVTLRDGKTGDGSAKPSLTHYNVVINENDIVSKNEVFQVTGSISANNDETDNASIRVYGDVLFISNATK
jgi:hypothetical protein